MANNDEHLNKKRCMNQEDELKRRSSTLPTDIMLVILDKLLEPIDHARFARVCKEWHSLTKQYSRTRQPWLTPPPPMLYVPTASRAHLYSVSETRIYNNLKLPVLERYRVYCGHGWVSELTKDYDAETDMYRVSISLVKHFGKSIETIRLPILITKPAYHGFCLDCFLSADPILNRDNYVVIVRHNLRTFLFKSGPECWEILSCLNFSPWPCITYYQGRVYGINPFTNSQRNTHKFVSYDVNSFEVKEYIITKPQSKGFVGETTEAYLVTTTKGDLLFVNRIMDFVYEGHEGRALRITRSFEVYKLVLDGSILKLVKVNNIEDEALFVGENQSFSCSASNNFSGCQPNCIHYTKDEDCCRVGYPSDYYEVGIFNLENGSITQLSQHYPQNELEKLKAPAVWITPSFAFE